VKKPGRLLIIGLLSASLIGCATSGRGYDDHKVAMIKKEVTTETELLDWFGPATTRAMGMDGSKTLAWKFPSARFGSSSGKLEVRLGPDGKVIAYSASATGH
jgi:hypothetical protein